NRSGRITGLTMRVGRAVTGTGEIIRDIVVSGQSILLLGRPGIGKTTMLRECARLLADELRKRVVIVDTSNEIGGDGDIPHPGIGRARRMQVRTPLLQHAVMIEAVENHMPEVIVIDEIGTELEAAAARTIAERGVQLIATAHGQTLENLLVNPTLNDLLGGIQSVTLSDCSNGPVRRPRGIFPYGVSRLYLEQSIRDLDLPVRVLGNLDSADLVFTLKNYYRRRPDVLRQAESAGVPVHILKSNSVAQVKEALGRLYDVERPDDSLQKALNEAMEAIRKVKSTLRPAEISPKNAYVRRLQQQL